MRSTNVQFLEPAEKLPEKRMEKPAMKLAMKLAEKPAMKLADLGTPAVRGLPFEVLFLTVLQEPQELLSVRAEAESVESKPVALIPVVRRDWLLVESGSVLV